MSVEQHELADAANQRIHRIDDGLPPGRSCVHWLIGWFLGTMPEVVNQAIDEYESEQR